MCIVSRGLFSQFTRLSYLQMGWPGRGTSGSLLSFQTAARVYLYRNSMCKLVLLLFGGCNLHCFPCSSRGGGGCLAGGMGTGVLHMLSAASGNVAPRPLLLLHAFAENHCCSAHSSCLVPSGSQGGKTWLMWPRSWTGCQQCSCPWPSGSTLLLTSKPRHPLPRSQGVKNVADVAKELGSCQRLVLVSSCLVTPARRFHPIRILLVRGWLRDGSGLV